MAQVAWIGLGVMGYPMAGHVLKNGFHNLTVYNRTQEKAQRWVFEFDAGALALNPAEAASRADFIFSCVGNDEDVRSVTTGPQGAFHTMRPGAIFIDTTTTSATLARELSKAAAEKGLHFIDAPVSGGQAGAQNGTLTVMCGGEETSFQKAKPIIKTFAREVVRIGPSGDGQLTKMVNQICVAGLIQALAEGLHFAKRAELDVEAVMKTISKGAAQSWQMENRWWSMMDNEFDFGFAVDLMRKDMAICLEESRRNGANLPVTALVDRFYGEVQSMGGNRWDTSSLIARLNALKSDEVLE